MEEDGIVGRSIEIGKSKISICTAEEESKHESKEELVRLREGDFKPRIGSEEEMYVDKEKENDNARNWKDKVVNT